MNTRRQKLRRALLALFFLALPITLNYYSPYLMLSGTAEGVATFSLVFWLGVFGSALILGRSFCGWACPFNGLQQLWESVGTRSLKRVVLLPALKYVFWALWVASLGGALASAGVWTRFDPLYMTEYGVSLTEAGNLITYFMLVALTLVPALLGKRGFCRYLCPFGVWGIAGEEVGHALRIPRLMLRAVPGRCNACGRCTRACPMQLPVTEMVQAGAMRTTECFMCETCVDVCPRNAIEVGFGRAE
ncbi:MAG: 4Fe-4S binding protein [Coriobacteriia bacterium]|nr:4Fe-4S binding protein [Coriobacteriia bacterium]MBN2839400.1 4Fe-4S binding protein [Coriobacteriia bacterium]